MILELKPYQRMKPSGVAWLGAVPEHWEVKRTKKQFRLSIEKSGASHGKELLSIYTHIGVRPRKDLEEKGNKATSTDDYWVVRNGDLIVNKLLAWMGAVGVSHYDGVTSPAYDILRPITRLKSDYYHHLFRTDLYKGQFKARSRGIMDMRLRLYFDQFGQIEILCPPLSEQAAIVRFLDYADRRIRRYIAAKQKLIKLLEEQKQAIIHRAVTRGLDRNVRLKPSGVEWLGDVPEHWEVKAIGRIGSLFKGGGGNKEDEVPFGIPCVRYGDLYTRHEFFITDTKSYLSTVKAPKYTPIRYGDVLFAASGETIEDIGRSAVNLIESEASCGGDILVFRPAIDVVPRFLGYAADSTASRNQKANMGRGFTVVHIYGSQLKSLILALPPLTEQAAIARFLDEAIASTAAATGRTLREISLLREYHTRLIADVVTGKLDVHEAAARLPDEVETLDPIDDEELLDASPDDDPELIEELVDAE